MYELHPADDHLKNDILRWRNAPAVRRVMITKDIITKENHDLWWERVKTDPSKRLFVLSHDARPAGVLSFFGIGEKKAWWGFYPVEDGLLPGSSGLQTWLALEQAALVYAFDYLELDELYGDTRHDNQGVLSLHGRFGFETLSPEDFPDATARNLIIQRMSKGMYGQLKASGELPLLGDIRIYPHPADRPATVDTSADEPGVRIAVLGSANWDIAARQLAGDYRKWTGHPAQVYTPPFGQAALELVDPASVLRTRPSDFVVFAERFEDFIDAFELPGQSGEAIVLERFERFCAMVLQARQDLGGTFIIHDLSPVRPWPQSLAQKADGSDAISQLCKQLNDRLAALCADLADTILLPLGALVRQVGTQNADPGKYWMLGRLAYGKALNDAWSSMVTGIVLGVRGQTARALVLDLDNTLWGGVIGDDGIGGIRLGSDYPGNEFRYFQNAASALRARGIPLTISSKNTEHIALDAIARHPEMVLREKDFAAFRINWQPKSQNIRELAAELSLGTGSLLFVDDNPVERDEVRRNCPDVIVPEMPVDVSGWPEFLLGHPALTAISLSREDMDRSASYEIRRKIQDAEKRAPSREAFLEQLGMTLVVSPVNETSMQRVLQLIGKTNQFNTTGKRYTAAALLQKTADGSDILTLRLQDRFGSDELIGVAVTDYDTATGRCIIDNFIMSCRVLGRGVEAGVLAVISERAIARNCRSLEASVIPTSRNEPSRTVYRDNGFMDAGNMDYRISLDKGPLPRPGWLKLLAR